ncbi:MAG: MFS transporter [Firmicutes bacterium]|nr:MFS transporter [Bacillota bacterium]
MEKANTKVMITLATMLGAFWAPFVFTSVNVALPTIGLEFNAAPAVLSWILSATLLSTAMFVIPIGKLSDVYGRKKTLLIGSVILTVTSFLCGTAPSIPLLIFYRSLQGIGGAMLTTTVISIVTAAFPPAERGKALGINVACTYIGLSAGPFLGGFIVQNLNWRGIFFLSVPIGIVLLLLTLGIRQEWKEQNSEKLDYAGSLLYAMAILAVVWGLSNLNSNPAAKYTLLAGVLLMLVFGMHQFRVRAPLLDLRTMKKNKVLVFSSLAALINYSSTYAISYMMSLFLQSVQGIDAQTSGLILLIQPAFQALFSPVAGILSDRFEPQYVASAGMGLIAVCLFCLGMINAATPLYLIVFLLAAIGTGFALFSSPNVNSIMSSVGRRLYGVASGLIATARTVGQSFSMAITAFLTTYYLGSRTITAETAGLFVSSFRTTFTFFSLFCLLGVFASLARGKRGMLPEQADTE